MKRLATEQKKESANRSKQKQKAAILHEKIASQRYDFIHQETAKFAVKSHATSFAVEDLHIKGMVKTENSPEPSTMQAGGDLDYKCQWNARTLFVLTDSSQAPSGAMSALTSYPLWRFLSIREWTCPQCRLVNDRDINAAKNIRDIGLADSLGRSDCVKSPSIPCLLAQALQREVSMFYRHESKKLPLELTSLAGEHVTGCSIYYSGIRLQLKP